MILILNVCVFLIVWLILVDFKSVLVGIYFLCKYVLFKSDFFIIVIFFFNWEVLMVVIYFVVLLFNMIKLYCFFDMV